MRFHMFNSISVSASISVSVKSNAIEHMEAHISLLNPKSLTILDYAVIIIEILKNQISELYVIVTRDQHRASKQRYWLALTLLRSMGVAKNRSIYEGINNIANVEM